MLTKAKSLLSTFEDRGMGNSVPPSPLCLDYTACDTALLTDISHRSAISIFGTIRRRISQECERQPSFNYGEVELMNPTSSRIVSVASADEEHCVRPSSSVFSSAATVSIRGLSLKTTLLAIIRDRILAKKRRIT